MKDHLLYTVISSFFLVVVIVCLLQKCQKDKMQFFVMLNVEIQPAPNSHTSHKLLSGYLLMENVCMIYSMLSPTLLILTCVTTYLLESYNIDLAKYLFLDNQAHN